LEMQQIGADLLLSELIRELTIVPRQPHHRCNVGLLSSMRNSSASFP
jgi:hypothetical protein